MKTIRTVYLQDVVTIIDNDDITRIVVHGKVYDKVKFGKWEEYQKLDADIVGELQSAKCSICGRYHTTPYMHSYDYYKYCPHCGAIMEIEE